MFARNVCFVLVVARLCQAFYVPGVAPEDYKEGDPVEIKVDSELKRTIYFAAFCLNACTIKNLLTIASWLQAVKITSVKAQLPYTYYSLPFCKPETVIYKSENLGKLFDP